MGTRNTTAVTSQLKVKVADEVWIVTALLHREQPAKPDFSIEEIVERARREAISTSLRPGVYVHIVQHCVANRSPNPGRYRMLFESSEGRRRLFRKGDAYHPAREGAKITPEPEATPNIYKGLLAWYEEWSLAVGRSNEESDPLIAMMGSGKELWKNEHSDSYVRRLREGWE